MDFALLLDITVAFLLVVTIGYAFVLNQKLTAIRRDRAELESVAASFAQATLRAEESIRKLKMSADGLQGQIDKSDSLREDLAFLVQRGGQAADRLEELVRDARAVEPSTARPAQAAPEPMAGQQQPQPQARAQATAAPKPAPAPAPAPQAKPAAPRPLSAEPRGMPAQDPVEPAPPPQKPGQTEPQSEAERELLKALQSVR
ncbi:MAG: DUF6468 domain-containing protein [Magnetovibrionaceae bacterium]